jgi:hypothetical protein
MQRRLTKLCWGLGWGRESGGRGAAAGAQLRIEMAFWNLRKQGRHLWDVDVGRGCV